MGDKQMYVMRSGGYYLSSNGSSWMAETDKSKAFKLDLIQANKLFVALQLDGSNAEIEFAEISI